MKKSYMNQLVKDKREESREEHKAWLKKEAERLADIEWKEVCIVREIVFGTFILVVLAVFMIFAQITAKAEGEPIETPTPTAETAETPQEGEKQPTDDEKIKVEVSIDETETAQKTAEISSKLESLEKLQFQTLEIMKQSATTETEATEPEYGEVNGTPLPCFGLDTTKPIYLYRLTIPEGYYGITSWIIASNSSTLHLVIAYREGYEDQGYGTAYFGGLYKENGATQLVVGIPVLDGDEETAKKNAMNAEFWGDYEMGHYDDGQMFIKAGSQFRSKPKLRGENGWVPDDYFEKTYITGGWTGKTEGQGTDGYTGVYAGYVKGFESVQGANLGYDNYADKSTWTLEKIEQEVTQRDFTTQDLFIPVCLIAGAAVLYIVRGGKKDG